MSVVKVGPDDFEELAEVWEASVRATHDFLSEADIRELRSLLPVRYLPAVELRCLRDAGRIVAFIGLNGSHIAMLFVRPEYRGRGCGRKLVEWAVARQGADSVDVNEQNPQAVGFYRVWGLRLSGVAKRTMPTGRFRFCICVWRNKNEKVSLLGNFRYRDSGSFSVPIKSNRARAVISGSSRNPMCPECSSQAMRA